MQVSGHKWSDWLWIWSYKKWQEDFRFHVFWRGCQQRWYLNARVVMVEPMKHPSMMRGILSAASAFAPRSLPGNLPLSSVPPPYFLVPEPGHTKQSMAGSAMWKVRGSSCGQGPNCVLILIDTIYTSFGRPPDLSRRRLRSPSSISAKGTLHALYPGITSITILVLLGSTRLH